MKAIAPFFGDVLGTFLDGLLTSVRSCEIRQIASSGLVRPVSGSQSGIETRRRPGNLSRQRFERTNEVSKMFRHFPLKSLSGEVSGPSPGLNPGLRPGDGPNEPGGRDLSHLARSDRCQQAIQKSSQNVSKKWGNRLHLGAAPLDPLERYGCWLTLALCSASLCQSWPRKARPTLWLAALRARPLLINA